LNTLTRHIFIAVLVLFATTGMAWAESKIGAVNINKLMENAPQAKSASESMKSRFSKRESDLLAEREAIRKLEEQYKKDADVMAQADKEGLERKIRERLREFKRTSDSFTEDFSLARNEVLNKIQSDVYKAIVEIAEKDGYDIIVSESVLYASKRVDVTDKVLERLVQIAGGK
jgi:outer membrane protein